MITGRAVALANEADGKVTRSEQDFTAIPYYAWANRGPGEMLVWIPNRETSARPQPLPTLASKATVTSSKAGKDLRAVNDQSEPKSSARRHQLLLPLVAREGQHGVGRVRLREAEPACPRSRSTGSTTREAASAGCPASWRVLYKDGEEWKPVETLRTLRRREGPVQQGHLQPVTTSGLRLEVVLPPEWSAGIQEWKVR